MKRSDDEAKIIEMINRCEELILKAKKTAREIEEKVRKELELLARNDHKAAPAKPLAPAKPTVTP